MSMIVSFWERIRQCSIVQTSFESCIKYKNYNAHLHLSIKMSHPYYSRSNLLSFTPHQKRYKQFNPKIQVLQEARQRFLDYSDRTDVPHCVYVCVCFMENNTLVITLMNLYGRHERVTHFFFVIPPWLYPTIASFVCLSAKISSTITTELHSTVIRYLNRHVIVMHDGNGAYGEKVCYWKRCHFCFALRISRPKLPLACIQAAPIALSADSTVCTKPINLSALFQGLVGKVCIVLWSIITPRSVLTVVFQHQRHSTMSNVLIKTESTCNRAAREHTWVNRFPAISLLLTNQMIGCANQAGAFCPTHCPFSCVGRAYAATPLLLATDRRRLIPFSALIRSHHCSSDNASG